MAPRTPSRSAAKTSAKRNATAKPAKSPAATAAAKPKLTVWPAEDAHAHDHHHDHGACCGHHHHSPMMNPIACLCACCPIARMFFTRSFWAASFVAFIVIFATDWLLHAHFLVDEYVANSAFWRADGEIRHSLIFITQAVTAMAYAAIVIGMGQAGKWWGSFSSGALAAVPVAMCAMVAYIMLPFASAYIPTIWAVESVLQGGLAGLAISAALRASRAPEAHADGCPPHTTLH